MNAIPLPVEWLPTLPRRYLTTVVDALLVLAVIIVLVQAVPGDSATAGTVRFTMALAAIFIYEPLCTGRFVTVGQWITGVRVRRFDNAEKIGVLRAYGRLIVKGVLGFISFFALPFTVGRRAIHDMATGSIVIKASAEPEFVRWTREETESSRP